MRKHAELEKMFGSKMAVKHAVETDFSIYCTSGLYLVIGSKRKLRFLNLRIVFNLSEIFFLIRSDAGVTYGKIFGKIGLSFARSPF